MQPIADQGAQIADGLAPVVHIVLDQDARYTVTRNAASSTRHPFSNGRSKASAHLGANPVEVRLRIEAAERDVVADRCDPSPGGSMVIRTKPAG